MDAQVSTEILIYDSIGDRRFLKIAVVGASMFRLKIRQKKNDCAWLWGRRVSVLLVLLAAVVAPHTGHTQENHVADVMTIGSEILGDWYAKDDADSDQSHIRLDPGGIFYHGAPDNFGVHPMRWKAKRISLVRQEALVIEWSSKGTCAYHVRYIDKDGTQYMHWQPYRDYRDLGAYDSIITRAIWPWTRCEERTWARTPPEKEEELVIESERFDS